MNQIRDMSQSALGVFAWIDPLLEFVVSDLADTLESFPFQLVQLKGMRIPMSNPENGKFVVSPILNLDLN